MKTILTTLLSLCIVPLFAQEVHFGLEGSATQNTQLFFIPARPQDGTTQMDWRPGFGAGAYARMDDVFGAARRPTAIRTTLGYIRKGCSTPFQTAGAPIAGTQQVALNYNRAATTLSYLSFDAMVQQSVLRIGSLSLLVDAGVSTNVLLHSHIRASASEPMANAYFNRTYNDEMVSGANVSGILGLELKSRKGYSIFARSNRSLTPVFRSEDLRVKDWSWVYGLSVDIFSKSAKCPPVEAGGSQAGL